MDRRKFLGLGAVGAVLVGAGVQGMAALSAGKDFVALGQPLPVDTGGKIEVAEYFAYTCPHCYHLEPAMDKWVKALPKDVEFRRQPTVFSSSWAPGARIYYTLEALGELPRLHGKVFQAIHEDHVNLNDQTVLADWIVKQGVDRKKFLDVFSSFSVQSKVERAKQLSRDSKISGVPSVIVDGKYMTSASLTGGVDSMFAALDQLIQKARSERKK